MLVENLVAAFEYHNMHTHIHTSIHILLYICAIAIYICCCDGINNAYTIQIRIPLLNVIAFELIVVFIIMIFDCVVSHMNEDKQANSNNTNAIHTHIQTHTQNI